MNTISSKLNLDQLEETFEDDEEFDSAVQIKQEDSLQFSPSRTSKISKQSNTVRCSFGINSQQKLNPQRLQFSNQTSVNNSITSSKKKIQDTAQFPKYRKFLKRDDNDCQQIDELSVEYEQSVNQSKEQKYLKKQNLTIQTDEQDESNEGQSSEQLEYFIYQLMQELEQCNHEKEQLKIELQQQINANNRLKQLNKDITSTLDESQEQLVKLINENKKLKGRSENHPSNKINTFQSDDQRISTFLSSDNNESDQTTYSSKDRQYKNEKENSIYQTETLQQITKILNCPLNKLVKSIKKVQQTNKIYQNMVLMMILLISKCFYLDDELDQEGKEISIEIVQCINQKTLDGLISQTEQLMNLFERKFMDLVVKGNESQQQQSILSQIQRLVNYE